MLIDDDRHSRPELIDRDCGGCAGLGNHSVIIITDLLKNRLSPGIGLIDGPVVVCAVLLDVGVVTSAILDDIRRVQRAVLGDGGDVAEEDRSEMLLSDAGLVAGALLRDESGVLALAPCCTIAASLPAPSWMISASLISDDPSWVMLALLLSPLWST